MVVLVSALDLKVIDVAIGQAVGLSGEMGHFHFWNCVFSVFLLCYVQYCLLGMSIPSDAFQ